MEKNHQPNAQLTFRIERPQTKALETQARRDVARALGEILLAVAEQQRAKKEIQDDAE
jgi:hypothetical protein